MGTGAPAAPQNNVASLPSKTVTFWGGVSNMGVEAKKITIFVNNLN